MGTYGKEVAEKIIGSRICEFDVSDDGIRPKLVSVEKAEFDQLNNWVPLCELDDDDGPDPEIAPALPFHFAANHLAAWMLHGVGYFIREQYGDWADGPDTQALSKLGVQATKAKQALKRAFNAYRTAERVVGPYDTTYSEKIQELEKQYGSWPDAQDAREQIKQAHRDADDYEAAWRKKMVNHLLAGTGSTPTIVSVEELPATDAEGSVSNGTLAAPPVEASSLARAQTATPAPVVAASDGPAPLTTNQIAVCFAGFHDWDHDKWKQNLQSPSPWLLKCQQRPGSQGGCEGTWFPLLIAEALDKKHPKKIRLALHARFKKQEPLKPWFEQLEINLPLPSEI